MSGAWSRECGGFVQVMKRTSGKALIWAIEALGVCLAIVAVAAGLLLWRLTQGPVSLDALRPAAQAALQRSLPSGYHVEIEELTLSRDREFGSISVTVNDLAVFDASNERVAFAPRSELSFRGYDAASRGWIPTEVVIDDMALVIARRADGSFDFATAGEKGDAASGAGDLLDAVLNGRSAFRRIRVRGADIAFIDEAHHRSWSAPDAEFAIVRTGGDWRAHLSGQAVVGENTADFDIKGVFDRARDRISVDFDTRELPVEAVLSVFYGDAARFVSGGELTGTASADFTREGRILAANFDWALSGGTLRLAGQDLPIEQISSRAEYDPSSDHFKVEAFDYAAGGEKGSLSGEVSLISGAPGAAPKTVNFDITAKDVVLDLPGLLQEPISAPASHWVGGYDVKARRIVLNGFQTTLFNASASGDLDVTFAPGVSPGVKAHLAIDGDITPADVMRLWPVDLVDGAREWVHDGLHSGALSNISFEMDMAPGAVSELGHVPEDAMTLKFSFRNVVIEYVDGMTPLRDARGTAVLRGNSFRLSAPSGRIGAISLSNGSYEIPRLTPKGGPSYVRAHAQGDASDILTLLDEPPLELVGKVGVDPDDAGGKADVDFEINRPMYTSVAPEDIDYSASAKLENVSLQNFYGDADLSEGVADLALDHEKLVVEGDAKLADVPVGLKWTQRFFDAEPATTFEVHGDFNSALADLLGVPTRRYLRGPVKFAAVATGDAKAIQSVDLNLDFASAELTLDAIGWRKPEGAPAAGMFQFDLAGPGLALDKFTIKGAGADIEGSVAFDPEGRLSRADIPRLFVDNVADARLTALRDGVNGPLSVRLTGAFFDVGALIAEALRPRETGADADASPGFGAGLDLSMRLDRIRLRDQVELSDVAFDLDNDGTAFQKLDFSGFLPDSGQTRLTLSPDAENGVRGLIIDTPDLGAVMRGFFDVKSLRGGVARVTAQLGADGVSGKAVAQHLHVVNAPVAAQILSAGSFTGLNDLMVGEGIQLTGLDAGFTLKDGVFTIIDGRATGPAVGVTLNGAIDLRAHEAKLSGAVAPVYGVNSMLGNIPLIGDVFVSRQGEGVIALAYQISGPLGKPTIFVNPLSALAPGVLRRMFEPAGSVESAPAPDAPAPDAGETAPQVAPVDNAPAPEPGPAAASPAPVPDTEQNMPAPAPATPQ